MSDDIRVVRGVAYRQLAIVNPGGALFFTGAYRIAVETWALDWGQHEFDYELNSRAADAQGRPQAIATTEAALAREFMERRAVMRQVIPISVGADSGRPKVALTMGEVSPQVYESRVRTGVVAWTLHFRSHRLVASAQFGLRVKGNVAAVAQTTVTGQMNPSGLDYLMVRVPVAEYARFRILPGTFGVTDVIGRDPGLVERWTARVFGR